MRSQPEVIEQSNGPRLAAMTLRIERHRLDALRQVAASHHRTLTQHLREMVDRELAAHAHKNAK